MKAKKKKSARKDSMRAHGHPAKGLERDNKGKPVPMTKRLKADRAEAHAAAKRKAKKRKKK